jgi:hypothetical protein
MVSGPSQHTILRAKRLIEELRAHGLPTREAEELLAMLQAPQQRSSTPIVIGADASHEGEADR